MQNTIVTAPCAYLKSLDNLFIELSAKNCNLKCKHCYIDFDPYKKIKDFIGIDTIKTALSQLGSNKPKYIYLTGAEPMIHPDFNAILRLCLKYANVTVHTNAMTINDKKARFLRKVQDETDNELIFKVSFEHYEELKNDNVRGRGVFRKAVYALQCLVKYGFNPIITLTDYYKEDYDTYFEGFNRICGKFGFELEPDNLLLTPVIDKKTPVEVSPKMKINTDNLDCSNSRMLTKTGVYTCPLLANDSRGKSGTALNDFSRKSYLETNICAQCASFNNKIFSNDWV